MFLLDQFFWCFGVSSHFIYLLKLTKITQRDSSRSYSFLKNEGIRCIFHKSLAAVQLFQQKSHLDSGKGLEEKLLVGVTNESICWAGADKKILFLVLIVHFIHFSSRAMSTFTSDYDFGI